MRVDAGVVASLPTGVLRAASDQRLVEQVRAGSHPAFETLFDRHHRGVLAFCAHMLGSHVEAEDAAQQTFLVAYRDLVQAAQPIELRPWLYGIARHRCLVAMRGRRERPIGVVSDPGRSYDLTADVGVRADVRALLADVAQLPKEQRAALVLAELGDLSHEEIACVLACPRTKVKALVFQARASLNAAREARETPCAEIRELLTTLRGPALMRATLQRHLADCPGCRAYRDGLRSRRREFGARLPVGLTIALKRCLVGAAARPGTGALTGGALGETWLPALVAVTIAASGSGPAVLPSHDRHEPVGPIVHAALVPSGGQQMGTRPSVDQARGPDIPGAALRREGSPGEPASDPAETPSDPGVIGADERPAPLDIPADDDQWPSDEPVAEIGEPLAPYEDGPSQPLASGAVPDSGGVRAPVPTLPWPDAGPARPAAPRPPVSSTVSSDQPTRQQGQPEPPLRADTDHAQPPSPPRPASEQSQARTPSRLVNDHAQPSPSPGRADHQAQPTRPQPDAGPTAPRPLQPEAQPAGDRQVRPAQTAPSGEDHGQPASGPAREARQRDERSVASRAETGAARLTRS
jgi:RNA polymerase sigma factor (sigma-70 family)